MTRLPALAALAGCCANSVCDCQDGRADALTLQFRVSNTPTTTTGSFAPADVDTVYVLRYARTVNPVSRHARRDSVRLVRPGALASSPLVINHNTPFAAVGGRRLNEYSYKVFVRLTGAARDTAGRKTYLLRDIVLRGAFEGTGCCTCYRNTTKELTLDGQAFKLTEKDDRQPVPLELTP